MMTYIGATRLKEVPKRTTFVLVGAQRNTIFDS
jgi:GMP reductase